MKGIHDVNAELHLLTGPAELKLQSCHMDRGKSKDLLVDREESSPRPPKQHYWHEHANEPLNEGDKMYFEQSAGLVSGHRVVLN